LKKSPALFLEQMKTASKRAISYMEGVDRAHFLTDGRTQMAVAMCIVVIGEASRGLLKNFPDFERRYPSVPWLEILAMRNRIAHGYSDINLDVVWSTSTEDIPMLLDQLEKIPPE
jgi:uncharacterized protein with HEPN domain